jgi:DNA-binding CsgD family transcriptional regulator
MRAPLTFHETQEVAERQIFSLENKICNGICNLNDAGSLIPGAIMVHDFNRMEVTYMNDWGCEKLNHSKDEINAMGEAYYNKFFKLDQLSIFRAGMIDLFIRKDETELYSFFHQVKIARKDEWNWYFAIVKYLRRAGNDKQGELILTAHPVSGMGNMVNKVVKTLDENEYVVRHYKKFALLSKREKEIITLLALGNNNAQISEVFFISLHTVKTHRKNIIKKLGFSSFALLVRFAVAFDMVS